MGSAQSIATGSDVDSTKHQKRKHDASAGSNVKPSNSKQTSRNKTNDLNSVIIYNALNSTFNRMVDVMERSLDVSAATVASPTIS